MILGTAACGLSGFVLAWRFARKKRTKKIKKESVRHFFRTYLSLINNEDIVKAIQESRIPYSLLSVSGEFLCFPMTIDTHGAIVSLLPEHQMIEDVSKEFASFDCADLDNLVRGALVDPKAYTAAGIWSMLKEKGEEFTRKIYDKVKIDAYVSLYNKVLYLYESLTNYGIIPNSESKVMFDAFLLSLWACAVASVRRSDRETMRMIREDIELIKDEICSGRNQFLSAETIQIWNPQHIIRDNDFVEILYSYDDYDEASITCHLANRIYLRQKNILWADAYYLASRTVRNAVDMIQKREYIENLLNGQSSPRVTIQDVDKMDPARFEQLVASLFNKMGYEAYPTKQSRDQGVDVIAHKRDRKIAIQAKCYHHSVGNSAIQEVVAGKFFYKADDAFVITNSTFTKAAKQLASANNVKLWDREYLSETLTRFNFCECDFCV